MLITNVEKIRRERERERGGSDGVLGCPPPTLPASPGPRASPAPRAHQSLGQRRVPERKHSLTFWKVGSDSVPFKCLFFKVRSQLS